MFNLFKKTKKQLISLTDIGHRQVNQDAYESLSVGNNHLLCTADGLGGHEAGEIAAKTLCNSMRMQFVDQMNQKTLDKETFQQHISKALEKTREILSNNSQGKNAHTTMALAWIDDTQVLTAHIGDSRVMAISPKQGRLWRTRDHSVVQMLVDHGEVAEEDMGTHNEQGKLTKSISADKIVEASIKQHPKLNKDECLMACSDGFWEHISLDELQKLAKNPTEKNLQSYINLAKKRAAPKSDNITVQIFVKL